MGKFKLSMTAPRDVNVHAGRYRTLLTQGTFYTTGLQLSNAAVVLPFICAQQGIFWAGGLLYPVYSVGLILGNSVSPFVLERSRHLKHLVLAATALAIAALVVCNAIVAVLGVGIATVFLATSAAIGIANGLSKVAVSDVLSIKLTEIRRSDLILNQAAAGALLAVASTLLLVPVLDRRDPISTHLHLLWVGAAALAIAAIAALLVGPIHSHAPHKARRMRDLYRDGITVARTHGWYRGYLATQLLFVPIGLGATFYSLHAAHRHGNTAGSLHVLVIAAGIGMVIGAFLWRRVHRSRHGVRGMLVLSASVGCAAAAICITTQWLHEWSGVWAHGVVILLATVANQAILAASIAWINLHAADQDRATLIALTAGLVAIETTLLGAILGGIAQQVAAIWPVAILLSLNLLAVVSALRAPARG
jgi:MFS family permease